MNKLIIFSISLLITLSAIADTVYKNKNSDGSVTYTDTPSANSEKIKIRKPTTYTPTRLPPINSPTKKLRKTFNYSVAIKTPAEDSVINKNVNVVVSISVTPKLLTGKGHQFRYSLAGDSIQTGSLTAVFKNVSRGTHNLTVSVIDKEGKVVSPVASSVFHMKRFFIRHP